MRMRRLGAWCAIGIALGAVFAGPVSAARKHPGEHNIRKTVERMQVVMGTPCTIIAEGVDSVWTSVSVDSAFTLIRALDDLMTMWRPGSELAALDTAQAEVRTRVSPALYAVIDSALVIADETEGAFDPTIEPLTEAWDLRGDGRTPSPDTLYDARHSFGWHMVQIEPTQRTVRFRREHMGFDLDGIGKGFALDVAISFLRTRRLSRVLIDFGSDLECFSDLEPWTIDIGDPDDRNQATVRLITRQGAVSTSGGSARFLTNSGGHFDRVIDPTTGHPLEHGGTVTVVARSGTRSDALATGLLVMGREKITSFLQSHGDLGVLWLERQGRSLRGWRWNLPTASVVPNAKVEWAQ